MTGCFILLLLLSIVSCSTISPFGECFGSRKPAMVRTAGFMPVETKIEAKIDLVTCSSYCRRNSHPSTEVPFPCRGFNFRVGRHPTCSFIPMDTYLPASIEHKQFFYFYEKQCLDIPSRCDSASFIMDARKGVRLRSEADKQSAADLQECIELCLEKECPSFEWDEDNKQCHFYSSTSRNFPLERAEHVTYYENNCIDPSSRCPNGRIEFLLAKNSDVPSFGVSVGLRSVRNCMRECIETTLFFCKSFQFESNTQECFISDESSDVAVSSHSLDLYEPFCVPKNIENNCNRPYSFEKILTTRMSGAGQLEKIEKCTVERCLSKCWADHHCLAVNYDVTTRSCFLLNKKRGEAVIGPADNFDFYEVSCHKQSVTPPPAVETRYRTAARGRVFRKEFETKRTERVDSARQCGRLCESAQLNCRSFCYSSTRKVCLFSKERIENLDEIAQENGEFDVYVIKEQYDVTVPDSFTTTSTFPKPSEKKENRENKVTQSWEEDIFAIKKDTFVDQAREEEKEHHQEKFPEPPKVVELETLLEMNSVNEEKYRPNTSLLINSAEVDSELTVGSIPRVLPVSEGVGFAQPESVMVEAMCHPNGINVSFTLGNGKYSGAVYAAERFEQCRIFMRNQSEFALFVPRPQHNTWCNSVEVDGTMSVMLVMSNDRILPHDVTTVHDLFYHISCNYETPSIELRKGIVVGGPSPVLVPSREHNRSISLRITRGGQPVDSVYIGETLVAHVESDLPPQNLRVVDCSANRVGDDDPTASIHLIADGCALLPSLMTSMVLGEGGWRSTLSAFRVDGSEHVDIVCMVAVCQHHNCPQKQDSCPSSLSRTPRSSEEKQPVRVDSRLRVQEIKGHQTSMLPNVCVQPAVYISLLALLVISFLSTCIAICSNCKRRKINSRPRSRFMLPPSREDVGSTYINTVPL